MCLIMVGAQWWELLAVAPKMGLITDEEAVVLNLSQRLPGQEQPGDLGVEGRGSGAPAKERWTR